MDNQLFPGGNAFLDDVMPQVCPLCGLMFNSSLTYQHHMQLHFLSAANAQMLGTQPPPDPGIGMATPASILDLIGGVSQHTLSSNATVSLVPPQAVFSGAAAAMSTLPPHLISPGTGLTTSALPTMGIPPPTRQTSRSKEKKSKSQSSKAQVAASTSSNMGSSAANLLPTSSASASASFKSSDSSSSTYISSFPKDLQKLDTLQQSNPPNAQLMPPKPPADIFQAPTSQLDPLEALLYPSPVKQPPSGLDRQLSHNNSASSTDSYNVTKDVKKLFQPFVSNDPPVTLASFVSKSNVPFNTNSIMSPMKTTGNKHDVLTTPQKSSYQLSTENLFSSPTTLPNTHSSDLHHFGILQDNDTESASVDKKIDLPTKVAHHADDPVPMKSQYFPGIIESSSISPKSGKTPRKKDVPIDPLLKMNSLAGSVDHSRSSSPVSRAALIGDFAPARPDSPRHLVSPKISPALPGGALDTESASLPAKSHIFAPDVLPSASVPSAVPPVFSNTAAANTGSSSLASPAIDMAVNPLGTGYLNALTQKLFNPSFAMGSDFNKPGSSSAADSSDVDKGKSYFENGVLISNDYDKISDTNDEDDLDRWIDDIDDNKGDNIACEIEDLLNEFNEKQTDEMKNKSQVDDFIKDVIGEPGTSKPAAKETDAPIKATEETFNPSDEFDINKSLISEILEEEKEKIDKESKELENARLSASGLSVSATTTSMSDTESSSTSAGTVTSVSNSDPKMSSSTTSETPEKKDDDHVDFEIPRVGKLMKIRKYFENREQKRKEQTEKVAEIKIHEKTEPVIDDKPQTILVQVSKRKKIEYGPYLNRQSLLEGKPKNAVENTSPPKTCRPKPKPQAPEKRTFNLRERKTKTDFATLASTGSRTADGKRPEQKQQKSDEKVEKEKYSEETTEISVEDTSEKSETLTAPSAPSAPSAAAAAAAAAAANDNKIMTRHQEKKKDAAAPEERVKPKRGNAVKSSGESDNEKVKETEGSSADKETRKFSLRTRNAKTEKTDSTTEGKNLRKRTIRPDPDTNSPRVKVKKNEEPEQKSGAEAEEKVTRSKSKIKTTGGTPPDKSGIKKCSVNLGEKYTDPKVKIARQLDKSDKKVHLAESIEPKTVSIKISEGNTSEKNDESLPDKSNDDGNETVDVTECDKEFHVTDDPSDSKGLDTVDGDHSASHSEKVTIEPDHKDKKKGRKSPVEVSKKQGNIFDKMDQSDFKNDLEEKVVHSKKVDTQLVSITSTDNTDKKVTMKLKLGPDFQKAFEYAFNPKKRKHENAEERRQERAVEKKQERALEKKQERAEEKKQERAEEKKQEQAEERRYERAEEMRLELMGEKKYEHTEEQQHEQEEERLDETLEEPDMNVSGRFKEQTNANTKKMYSSNEEDENINFEEVEEHNAEHDDTLNDETPRPGKKMKHSVENEFQRLVDEAMKEAQKEGDSGKQEQRYVNLRRRLNENVKYNVDDSDEDVEKIKMMHDDIASLKSTPKGHKSQVKGTPKGKSKLDVGISESAKQLSAKKDVDVYDFTDTELSDTEESASKTLGFKPKYVSNLNLFGQKKLPFVSKPLSPSKSPEVENRIENVNEVEQMEVVPDTENAENAESAVSYVGKTVEPLKIKLSKIKPFKEKKHKHKKKKKKRDKERRDDEIERVDSESRESMDCISERSTNVNSETKKTDDVKSVESVNQEHNSNNSNEGEDELNDGGNSLKGFKKTKLKEKKHICEYCNVGFGQKCDLRRHVMIHTGERPWPCEICDKRFQRKTDLVKHTRTHTGEKPYACEFCDKRVSDKSQLNVHRRLHTGDRPYCCSKCGKRCITSSELSRHKVNCGDQVSHCSLCRKAFTIKECLGMHMKLHYRSRGKAFKCVKCAIGFDKRTDLDSHHCVDKMKNVYMCSECYEEFNDEMMYAEHIKTHDLGVLACNVCTNIFEDKHSLETHLCNLGMEKQRQYCCEICDLEFQDSDALSSHLTLHDEDVGSFMCDLCPEIFTIRKYFVDHLKVHDMNDVNTAKSSTSKADYKRRKLRDSTDTSDIERKDLNVTENGMLGPLKQEVESDDDANFGSVFSDKLDSGLGDNLPVQVKSEVSSINFPGTSNRSRASVISGTFRIEDEPDTLNTGGLTGSIASENSKVTSDSYNRSTDFLDSDKLFEPSDFTNSPDFSTLTDVDDVNPFDGGLSASLSKDAINKSAKLRQKSGDKAGKSVNYFNVNQKSRQYSNSSQSMGLGSSTHSADSDNSQSLRVLQKQNSLTNSMLLSSDTNATHSSHFSDRDVHRSMSHDFPLQDPQGKSSLSLAFAHSSQGKQWPGFSMSASDFVNSVLSNENKHDLDGIKHNQLNLSLSKGDSAHGSLPNRSDIFGKDNIENQLKSNLFSEFDLTTNSEKSNIQGNKHGSSSDSDPDTGSFQGLNQSGFNAGRFHPSLIPEKTDFSVFGQQFMSQYPVNTSYSSSVNNSTSSNSVSADVNKRHLQGLFSNRTDALHSNFYLSDSMKDAAGADKGPEDAATLLSNFDQF